MICPAPHTDDPELPYFSSFSPDGHGSAAHALHSGHPQHCLPGGAGICRAVRRQRRHQVPEDAVQGPLHGKPIPHPSPPNTSCWWISRKISE